MHELSLIESILACAARVAREHGGLPVIEIVLEIGALQPVNPDALQMAFDVVKQDTPLEAARLTWSVTPLVVACCQCGGRYEPADPPWQCPQCGGMGGQVAQGDELVVKSVVLSDA